jgi:hypothetical protein
MADTHMVDDALGAQIEGGGGTIAWPSRRDVIASRTHDQIDPNSAA